MLPSRADQVDKAHDALERHQWGEAFARFRAADVAGRLDADGLEGLARAAFWSGEVDVCVKAWERAYSAHLEGGDERRAAGAALEVARRHAQRVNPALAQGWRATAARLLGSYPVCPERGRLLTSETYGLILAGKLEEAGLRASEAYEIGVRSNARDVQMIALNLQGQVLVRTGQVDEGLRLVDESCAQAAAGGLDLYDTGILYCWTIGLCRDLADWERARELTEATASWSQGNELSAFPGICRIHRAELFRLQGDLARAEVEAQSALDELLPRTLFWAARACNEIGIIKLRQGALDEAEAAFERAQELGMDVEPGRALVLLTRGKHETARVRLTRALERRPSDVLDRAALLSALVDAAIACGEIADATSAADELETIAQTLGRPAFGAVSAAARGAVLLAEGSPGPAMVSLRAALQLWIGLDAPYEAARTRLLMAAAHRAEGDEASARFELEVAARAFEKVGARLDRASARATRVGADPFAPLTRRQREVARLVAEGRSNRDIAARLCLSERTAEYHVQQILNRLGLESRSQIAAWYARRG